MTFLQAKQGLPELVGLEVVPIYLPVQPLVELEVILQARYLANSTASQGSAQCYRWSVGLVLRSDIFAQ